MIEHLVLLKIKNTNYISRIIESLNELPKKINCIESLSVGENFCERNKGFQIGLRVTFKSKEDLDQYQVHEDHQKVLNELIKPHIEDIIALDYSF